MKKDAEKTIVVFRKFKEGDVIALFPEIPGSSKYDCLSYMTIGQHSSASLEIVRETTLAKPEEYKNLKNELEEIGYNLVVKSKISSKMDLNRFRNFHLLNLIK